MHALRPEEDDARAAGRGADAGRLRIARGLTLALSEIEIRGIRAQGAGGQNVNKVASAVHLRFDIRASSLPDALKRRLLETPGQRISKDGIVVIKSQTCRTQDANRSAALERLRALIAAAAVTRAPRKPTRPTQASRRRRLESKAKRAYLKRQRARVDAD